MKPLNNPMKEAANKTGYSMSTIKRWREQQLTQDTLEGASISGRPSKSFPLWCLITIQNTFMGKTLSYRLNHKNDDVEYFHRLLYLKIQLMLMLQI